MKALVVFKRYVRSNFQIIILCNEISLWYKRCDGDIFRSFDIGWGEYEGKK